MLNKKYWGQILIDVIGNVLAAGIIACVAILVIDKFYSTPSLVGFWDLKSKVESTSLQKYKGLELVYQISLIQNQLNLSGSGDKFSEKLSANKKAFYPSGKGRTNIKLQGYIEKRIFQKNRVHLSVEEEGLKRKSTTHFTFEVLNNNKLVGNFSSTIANAKGEASLSRRKNSN